MRDHATARMTVRLFSNRLRKVTQRATREECAASIFMEWNYLCGRGLSEPLEYGAWL